MRSEDIPELPGYLTVQAVGKLFGIAKESVFWKIYTQKAFQHVYKVGSPDETQRPVLLILEDEAHKVFKQEQLSRVREDTDAEKLNAWNKRVKQWGRDTGWDTMPIRVSGRPPM